MTEAAHDILARAHLKMAPDQIAAHAQILADFVVAQQGFIAGLLKVIAGELEYIEQAEKYAAALGIGVRRVQSLVTRRQKAAAWQLLAQIASIKPVERTGAVVDLAALARINDLPACVIDPTLFKAEGAS